MMQDIIVLIQNYNTNLHLVALTRGACARIPTLALPSVKSRTDSTSDASFSGVLHIVV